MVFVVCCSLCGVYCVLYIVDIGVYSSVFVDRSCRCLLRVVRCSLIVLCVLFLCLMLILYCVLCFCVLIVVCCWLCVACFVPLSCCLCDG